VINDDICHRHQQILQHQLLVRLVNGLEPHFQHQALRLIFAQYGAVERFLTNFETL